MRLTLQAAYGELTWTSLFGLAVANDWDYGSWYRLIEAGPHRRNTNVSFPLLESHHRRRLKHKFFFRMQFKL